MNENARVPDLLLEKLAAGELDSKAKASVLKRLESEPGGMTRLEQIHLSNTEILEAYPSRQMAANIVERAAKTPEPHRGRSTLKIAIPLSFAALSTILILFIVNPFTPGQRESSDPFSPNGMTDNGIRLKGEPMLRLYKRTSDEPVLLERNAAVGAGDQLQIKYVPENATHGVIFSIDGSGVVTLHFPASTMGSTKLDSKPSTLDFAYTLDDAPNFERFYFITSSHAIDVEKVLQNVENTDKRSGSQLQLPNGLQQKEFTLRKKSGSSQPENKNEL